MQNYNINFYEGNSASFYESEFNTSLCPNCEKHYSTVRLNSDIFVLDTSVAFLPYIDFLDDVDLSMASLLFDTQVLPSNKDFSYIEICTECFYKLYTKILKDPNLKSCEFPYLSKPTCQLNITFINSLQYILDKSTENTDNQCSPEYYYFCNGNKFNIHIFRNSGTFASKAEVTDILLNCLKVR